MASDPVSTDDDGFPSPKDVIARRRLWTFIIVVVTFAGWLRYEWSLGGISPLFGPLHLVVHEPDPDASEAIVVCAIMLPPMFCYIAEPGEITALASIFATLAWLFFGVFWWTAYV